MATDRARDADVDVDALTPGQRVHYAVAAGDGPSTAPAHEQVGFVEKVPPFTDARTGRVVDAVLVRRPSGRVEVIDPGAIVDAAPPAPRGERR